LRITLYEEIDTQLYAKALRFANALDNIYRENTAVVDKDFISDVEELITTGDVFDSGISENLMKLRSQNVDRPGFWEKYIDFLNEKGESIIKPADLPPPLFMLPEVKIEQIKTGIPVYTNATINNIKVRTISYPYFSRKPDFYIIQTAASLRQTTHILRNRLLHILISISVILIASILISKNFTSKILRPVFEISKTAGNISEDNLSARVEGTYVDKEMRALVETFNSMIARLEQSFKVISDFSSQVAHELKTPLTIIRGESDIALRRERSTDEYKETIMNIVEESNRMLKIIEDILLLTKLNFPNMAFKFERINLIELLKDMYEQLVVLASNKKVAVKLNINDDPIYLNGHSNHIRRMFLNLIDNSIKYSGVNGRIDIGVSLSDNNVLVSISDTGTGIPEEDLPFIFDRFYRANTIRDKVEEGTGLGLSIVKSIIDIHGGSVSVKSEVGTGTTFSIKLPIA
jgi:heavy metal sensor kinase